MNSTLKKYALICVYDSPRKNQAAQELALNISEYWCQELANRSEGVYFTKTIDNALDLVKTLDVEWVVIHQTGNTFFHYGSFFKNIEHQLSPETLCIGHILDRKEHYFEIHSQCFVLNTSLYKKLGCPPYSSKDNKVSLTCVKRSPENFHGDYTPKWIEPKSETAQFESPADGALILDAALRNGLKVAPFNEKSRQSKVFIYDRLDFYDSLVELDFLDVDRSSAFAENTESPVEGNLKKPLSRLIAPASGLNPFLALKHFDYVKGDSGKLGSKLIIYDLSSASLSFYSKLIHEWDGRNYPSFVKKFEGISFKNTENLDQYWSHFTDNFGGEDLWVSWFEELKKHCEFSFKEINFLKKNSHKRPWLQSTGKGESLLMLSNIFHYLPTKMNLPHHFLIQRFNDLMGELKEKCPDLWVHFTIPMEKRKNGQNLFAPKEACLQAGQILKYPYQHFPWDDQRSSTPE